MNSHLPKALGCNSTTTEREWMVRKTDSARETARGQRERDEAPSNTTLTKAALSERLPLLACALSAGYLITSRNISSCTIGTLAKSQTFCGATVSGPPVGICLWETISEPV